MSVCGGLARHLNQRAGFLLAAGIAAPLNGAESAVPERYVQSRFLKADKNLPVRLPVVLPGY